MNKQMRAAQPISACCLPKEYFGKGTLRQCARSGKGDNIVLIELDSENFGNVIILDVPESLQDKFKKSQERHVISIDDDDDDRNESSARRSGMANDTTTSDRFPSASAVHSSNYAGMANDTTTSDRFPSASAVHSSKYAGMANDTTTSDRFPSASAVHSSNYASMANDTTISDRFPSASAVHSSNYASADDHGQFAGEGSNPVKLSKSKRTYSGTGISRNRYGLDSDAESCSSESDSDCELMEDSSGKLREQWEKAFFRRRHDTSCGHSDADDNAGPSVSHQHDHNCVEEGNTEHLKPTGNHSNLSSLNHDCDSLNFAAEFFSQQEFIVKEMDGLYTRKQGHYHGSCDLGNDVGTSKSDQPSYHSSEPGTVEHSELPPDTCCFKSSSLDHEKNVISSDFTERLAEESKSSQQGIEAVEEDKRFMGDGSDDVTKMENYRDVGSDHTACREQSDERFIVVPRKSGDGHNAESKSSSDYNGIITDRQKIKDTDVYKRAMEEELLSRQQQLQSQAEEARRLRNRKRAESTRITAFERRQRLRLEEVRETRRKDEEYLSLKDKLRAEIRNELRKLETVCLDMASLLRALGIHVNGGFCPSSNEVQAAYKRACLRFHPDRLTTTDLRQQVEAEEKFKLISNMKDKFLNANKLF